MGRGPTPEEISNARRKAIKQFKGDLNKALALPVDKHLSLVDDRGAHIARYGKVTIVLAFKVIHASNGEASGWVTADVSTGANDNTYRNSRFTSPPWLGGATPENVAKSVMHYVTHPNDNT